MRKVYAALNQFAILHQALSSDSMDVAFAGVKHGDMASRAPFAYRWRPEDKAQSSNANSPHRPRRKTGRPAPDQLLQMIVLKGFAWILVFQCVGEVIAQLVTGLWPGPVIGMLLLAFALTWRPLREPVSAAAHALLPHLSLLFVPIGVGVLLHTELIVRSGWALLAVLVISTWIGMAVTALVLRALWNPSRKAGHE